MGRAPSAVVALAGMLAVVLIQYVGGQHMAERAVAAGIALGLIAAASRRPAGALGVILAYIPFQLILLGWLYKHGAPAVVVKDAGYVKDAMTMGIGVAAVRARFDPDAPKLKLTFLDFAAVAYVGIASIYLLFPLVFHGAFGNETWSIRLNAWRVDCLFVVLMMFCRRVPFSRKALQRLALVVVLVGLVECGAALWETLDRAGYRNFLINTVDLPRYELAVFHGLPAFGYIVHSSVGGHDVVRDGGFFADVLELGFYTVVPFALGVQRLLSSRVRLKTVIPAVAAGTTAMLALTRSAILGCAVALLVLVISAFPRQARSRLPAVVLVVAAALVTIPLAGHSSAGARFASLFNGSNDQDNRIHSVNTRSGLQQVLDHPAGKGLGANPATGQRFGTSNATDTENSYLQVGTELGAAGMLAFVAMYLALLWELLGRARKRTLEGELPAALLAAGVGLFVGGFFLQVWISFSVALTFWGLSGALIGVMGTGWPREQVDAPNRADRALLDEQLVKLG